jgi:hypothetical protein
LQVANVFEDPHGHAVVLPDDWKVDSNLRLVGTSTGGVVGTMWLTSALQARPPGQGHVRSEATVYRQLFPPGITQRDYRVQMVDLERDPLQTLWHLELNVNENVDAGQLDTSCIGEGHLLTTWRSTVTPSGNPARWLPAYGLPDVYYSHINPSTTDYAPYLGFPHGAARWPTAGVFDFASMSRTDAAHLADTGALGVLQWWEPTCQEAYHVFRPQPGDIFVLLTSEGRLAKLRVTSQRGTSNELSTCVFPTSCWEMPYELDFQYVVFPGIYVPAP